MSEKVIVKFKRLNEDFNNVPVPEYATAGSSGMDIRAALKEEIILKPGQIELVPTNISVEIPFGYEIQVRPRSGLAIKHGISVLNSPGTIDSDYRGEVKIILINLSKEGFKISSGDRIAQLVLSKVYLAELKESDELNDSRRGEGGFGHTGKS
ncbi:MAG: dUTP diphosphatase [Ignavibacteriaceae bacterium]|nr:dUTP diphosphatase [Ignavibacteriaceae bacterium]